MSSPKDDQLLRRGIDLARSGERAQAREIFERLIQDDERNEAAWLWLASVLPNLNQRREALEIVLEINPQNERARQALDRLGGPRARRLAEQSQQLADRIGGEAVEEDLLQRRVEAEDAAAAPLPAPLHALEETRSPEAQAEDARRRLARQALLAARQQGQAEPVDRSPNWTEQVPQFDFAGEQRRRTGRRILALLPWLLALIVGVAGIALLVVLGAQLARQVAEAPPPPSATPELATALAARSSPTPSPLPYVVVTPRSGQETPLPPTWTPSATPTPTVTPRPSPTPIPAGRYRLVYVSRRTGDSDLNLYAIRADGSDLERLTDDRSEARDPAVNDGGSIAYIAQTDAGRDLALLALGGPAVNVVSASTPTLEATATVEDGGDETPQATPTAEQGAEAAPTAIALPPANLLTQFAGRRVNHPSWSPDRQQIVFSSDHDGDEELYVVEVATGNFFQLTQNEVIDRDPAWSPDGEWIAFASEQGGGGGETEIYKVRPDTRDLTRLTNSSGSSYRPAWSPDGSQIVFVSTRSGDADLYLIRADGANPLPLTLDDGNAEDRDPAWSPGGRWIAFSSNRASENFRLYLLEPPSGSGQTSSITPLTSDSFDAYMPAWFPLPLLAGS